MIFQAAEMDCKGVLEVLESVLIKNRDPREAELLGFLIYPIPEEELIDIINQPDNILLVAKTDDSEDEEIIGYFLGYSFDNWMKANPRWKEKITVSNKLQRVMDEEKCLFLFQIARKDGHQGLGKKLLARGLELAKESGFTHVVCDILQEEPGNLVSLEFFTKMGFENEGSAMYEDKLDWGLFLYEIE